MQELQLTCIPRSACFNFVIITAPNHRNRRRQLCLLSPLPNNNLITLPENILLRHRKNTTFTRVSSSSASSPTPLDSPEKPNQVSFTFYSLIFFISILTNLIFNYIQCAYQLQTHCISIQNDEKRKGSDLQTLARRFWKVAAPYWYSDDDKKQARLQLAAVFALTFATTGISVGFNFLGRDFYNALSSKISRILIMHIQCDKTWLLNVTGLDTIILIVLS